MKQAAYWELVKKNRVRCTLCPHFCELASGQTGICGVRRNVAVQLKALTYGRYISLQTDPMEKKPLYHFYPGQQVVSVGNVGCNFDCQFCQNWEIAHKPNELAPYLHQALPEELAARMGKQPAGAGVAFTYNEPVVGFEYLRDTAQFVKKAGRPVSMVSNGFINPKPLAELLPWVDAFSVDLKAFTEKFYRHLTKARLQPVLNALKQIHQAGKHLEITHLVIPGENDSPEEFTQLVQWIARELSPEIPLHISRYFPAYKLQHPPTPPATLQQFYTIARQYLPWVYLGNIHVPGSSDSFCPGCEQVLIRRKGYGTEKLLLQDDGRCGNCGRQLPFVL